MKQFSPINLTRNHFSLIVWFLMILFCFTSSEFLAQSNVFAARDYQNHARYWYYRTRLTNDFMKVGIGNGESIPMEERGFNYYPTKDAGSGSNNNFIFNNDPNEAIAQKALWGDALGELGYYIGTLAMEYRLLKNNGQNTEQTLKELYCALYALNRVDLKGETRFSEFVYGNSSAFPAAMNGFMIKDDVEADFITNNFSHFNYYGDKGFCSKIKINKLEGSSYSQNLGVLAPPPLPNNTSFPDLSLRNNWRAFTSQDNYYNVLVGLVLVSKFVDNIAYINPVTNTASVFQGGNTDIKAEARAIMDRCFLYFNASSTGFMLYPDGQPIPPAAGGFVGAFRFPHNEAVFNTKFNSWNHYNPTEGYLGFHDKCAEQDWLFGGNFFQDALHLLLYPQRLSHYYLFPHTKSGLGINGTEIAWKIQFGNIGNANDIPTMVGNMGAISNSRYDFLGVETKAKLQSIIGATDQYHFDLLKTLLYGYESQCASDDDSNYPWESVGNAFSIISNAPCETQYTSGPYNYWYMELDGNNNVTLAEWVGPANTYSEWSSTSRLDHPFRRYPHKTDFRGEFNGIDYMFYHNLYYLLNPPYGVDRIKLVNFSNRKITSAYPYIMPNGSSYGTNVLPASVGAYEFIEASNNVNAGANVSYIAGKQVDLLPGFTAINGCTFTAKIDHLDCSSIFNSIAFPNTNSRSMQIPYDSLMYLGSLPTDYQEYTEPPIVQSKNAENHVEFQQNTNSASNSNSPISRENIDVYPNPSNGKVKIDYSTVKNPKKIMICDYMGRQIFDFKIGSNYTNIDFDLSEYGKGLYVIIVGNDENKTFTKKIIVQ